MNIFYLHGFASAPGGTKERFFAERLAQLGLPLHAPDLNAGDFTRLTLTRMVAAVRRAVAAAPDGPVLLIGSSMGARAALHFLDQHRADEAARVSRMLFLAPAFEFSFPPAELARWRDQGEITLFHFGYQKNMPIRYDLVRDAAGYDAYAVQTHSVPILIYHGRRDTVIDYRQSLRFAEERPNVQMRLVDSDHLLHDQLATIWAGCVPFFQLSGGVAEPG